MKDPEHMNLEDYTEGFYTHCMKCNKKYDDAEFDVQACRKCDDYFKKLNNIE